MHSPTLPTATPDRRRTLVISAMALLLLCYTTARAWSVSFSWDESWTFMHHVRTSMFYQEAYDKMGGNHHLLNVWGMWVCWKLFGASELSMRLPSLAAHVLFLYASARLALKARTLWLAVACFLLLNLHPYLLDFFSLARGYGLSYGWMMLSLWQAWRYFQEGERVQQVAAGAACAALAAMSHVIMINYLLAYAGGFLLFWVADLRRTGLAARKWQLAALLGLAIAGLLIILPNALGLFQGGSLNFGCTALWSGMVRTIGEKFMYHQPYATPPLTIMGWLLLAVAVWGIACLVVLVRKRAWAALRPSLFGALVFGLVLCSLGLQHLFFNVPWPQSRTGLFLIPLLAFVLTTSFIAWPAARWAPHAAATLFCVPLVLHMGRSVNLTYAVEWKPSGEVRHMLDVIAADHLPLMAERPVVTLTSSDESWGCIPYYTELKDLHWLVLSHRGNPEPYLPSDYYIVEYDGFEQVDPEHWTLLYFSESTGTALYRDERMRRSQPELVFHARQDMEGEGIKGRDSGRHASGAYCVRFDTLTRGVPELMWTVPPERAGHPLLLCGSAQIDQHDDTNWMSLLIRVLRNGQEVERRDAGTVPQVRRFDHWSREAVMLRPGAPLQAGDEVHFNVVPLSSYPPMYVDDMELWVTE